MHLVNLQLPVLLFWRAASGTHRSRKAAFFLVQLVSGLSAQSGSFRASASA
jgi:hypothetical protein